MLLRAVSAKIVDELFLGVVQAMAYTLTQVSHGIKLLHAITEVLSEHVFPLRNLLLVIDLLNSLIQFGDAADTLGCTTDGVLVL